MMTARAAVAAGRALAALEGMSVDDLRTLAAGIGLAGRSFSSLSLALDSEADAVEFGSSDGLAQLAMRVWLKQAALDDTLLSRLADARGRPWVVIRNALLELRDAGEVGGRSG